MKGKVESKRTFKAKFSEQEARKLSTELKQIREVALQSLPPHTVYRSVDELIAFLDERGTLR